MVDLMSHVIDTVPFYRDRTVMPGYVVGGKTGTAQIWDAEGERWQGRLEAPHLNYSFVGFIGKDRPQLVIAVTIREAKPKRVSQGHLRAATSSATSCSGASRPTR